MILDSGLLNLGHSVYNFLTPSFVGENPTPLPLTDTIEK